MKVLNDVGIYMSAGGSAIGGFNAAVNNRNTALNYNTWAFRDQCGSQNEYIGYTASAIMVLQPGVQVFIDSALIDPYPYPAAVYDGQRMTFSAGVIQTLSDCLEAEFAYSRDSCFSSDQVGYYTSSVGGGTSLVVNDYVYSDLDGTIPIVGNFYVPALYRFINTNSEGRITYMATCDT
jgi:hypothetical protein